MYRYLALLLAVPAAIIAVGFGVGWVISGFKAT